MGGFTSWAKREQALPEIVSSGCDLILFSDHPEHDLEIIATAVGDGRISARRIDQALVRVLGMKATLRLHKQAPKSERSRLRQPNDATYIRDISGRAPTLLKDVNTTLPISVETHRRVLIHTTGITSIVADCSPLDLAALLRAEGFDVTEAGPGEAPDHRAFDLVLYLVADESSPIRGRIYVDWARLNGGDFMAAMRRSWHDVPTVLISFGHPYVAYDAPRAPCIVNAYAATHAIQEATLECLLGRAQFRGQSPVDWTCRLPDARW
jgi:beta-N-acetylhexosaminidase